MKRRNFLLTLGAGASLPLIPAFLPEHQTRVLAQYLTGSAKPPAPLSTPPFIEAKPWAKQLIEAAESQIGHTIHYDGAYKKLTYPGGDIPREVGVCTDVIVRAYRDAFDVDLQKLVHEDMRKNFSAYPKIWGLKRTDRNIDHRRVPNLEKFFTRNATRLEISETALDYKPGDLVSSRLPGNLPHIVIVTDRPSRDGKRPLIVHNIGAGTRIEDGLFNYKITGHFRFNPTA